MNKKPDGYLPDGTPVYIAVGRGSSKSTLQLRMYAKLCGLSDEEFDQLMALYHHLYLKGEENVRRL